MNKKLLLVAVALIASTFATTAFAAPCDAGANLQFVAVGSSAQFNTLAYAATDVIAAEGSTFNLFSVKGNNAAGVPTAAIKDVRVASNPLDSATLWVEWDSNSPCNVFAYYSVDSTVGNRAFFASQVLLGGSAGTTKFNAAGVVPALGALSTAGFCTGKCAQNQVGGLADNAAGDILPATVYTALSTPVVPQHTATTVPAPYCGQNNGAGSTKNYYCYFNAAGTDIRPEDALFATTRALTTPKSGLVGLGYNNANCTLSGGSSCQIYDSFNKGGVFNVLKFNITKNDPYQTAAAVPGYTTLSVGASPVVVFVGNGDANGFGKTYTDVNGNTSYLFNDILRKKLAFIFEGTSHCTGDILPDAPLDSALKTASRPGAGFGAGPALQVVMREPLSGTYNTFEFSGVRTMTGSSNAATNKPSTTDWTSDDQGGQEMFAQASSADETVTTSYPWIIDPGATGGGWSGGSLASNCGTVTTSGGINTVSNPNGTQYCSDPLFISSGSSNADAITVHCASGTYERLRAIGTGQEVPDTLGSNNTGAEQVTDGIGYAFWSYGNFSAASPSGSHPGHYLTVDSIDPLFQTEGGYGFGATAERNDSLAAWDLPQCNLASLPCTTNINFAHIYDGKYPLWSLLRVVTFPTSGTTAVTPAFVLDMVAYDQIEVANAARNTEDFVPFLTSLANTGTLTAPVWKGDLNLGVFRVHYKQTNNPANGHAQCAGNFTAIGLAGGSSHSAACLVDVGGDVGGSVMTVQDDVDFNKDFGGVPTEGLPAFPSTYEEYGLQQ